MSGDGVNGVNNVGNTSTQNHVDDNHTSGGSRGNTSTQNQTGTQKIIIFNEYGQPVDIGSTQFLSAVGKIAKAHCPPGIENWRRVPENIKEDIWRSVKVAYQVPEIYKNKTLKKANSAWRNWKGELRKICDRAESVAERKSMVVEGLKKEDWKAFVELHFTDEDKVRRDCGRNARKKVKILHTTSRKGCARVAHEMKKASPTGEVNRSALYLATHLNTSKNDPTRVTQSTSGFEYLEKIKRLIDEDPYLGEKDLDNDVVMVLGRDRNDYVHGMGQGVSKTEIRASAASREIARREKQKK